MLKCEFFSSCPRHRDQKKAEVRRIGAFTHSIARSGRPLAPPLPANAHDFELRFPALDHHAGHLLLHGLLLPAPVWPLHHAARRPPPHPGAAATAIGTWPSAGGADRLELACVSVNTSRRQQQHPALTTTTLLCLPCRSVATCTVTWCARPTCLPTWTSAAFRWGGQAVWVLRCVVPGQQPAATAVPCPGVCRAQRSMTGQVDSSALESPGQSGLGWAPHPRVREQFTAPAAAAAAPSKPFAHTHFPTLTPAFLCASAFPAALHYCHNRPTSSTRQRSCS